MAKSIADNYSYGGRKPNFERDTYLSTSAMQDAADEGLLDVGHICYIQTLGKHYLYNGSAVEPFGGSVAISPAADNAITLQEGTGIEVRPVPYHSKENNIISGNPIIVISTAGQKGFTLNLGTGLEMDGCGLTVALDEVFDFTKGFEMQNRLVSVAVSTDGGLHMSGYGLRVALSEEHYLGTETSPSAAGNPLVVDPEQGLTLRIDNTLKVTAGVLGVNEMPTVNVEWTNGLGQLDTNASGEPIVGLKLGVAPGLAVSDEGGGSLYVQTPDSRMVDSAFLASLGSWNGTHTSGDTVKAGGGLLRSAKHGLSLYLDTNYFKAGEESQYGGGPAPITLNIAAIAQAVASFINVAATTEE